MDIQKIVGDIVDSAANNLGDTPFEDVELEAWEIMGPVEAPGVLENYMWEHGLSFSPRDRASLFDLMIQRVSVQQGCRVKVCNPFGKPLAASTAKRKGLPRHVEYLFEAMREVMREIHRTGLRLMDLDYVLCIYEGLAEELVTEHEPEDEKAFDAAIRKALADDPEVNG